MTKIFSATHIRNIKLFAVAMFAVLGIGLVAPLQAHANIYTTADGKTCKERTFSTGSQSVCVSYLIGLMNASGKVSKANQLTPGVNFGPRTKAAVQEFQRDTNTKGGDDGIVGVNTWGKLCALGRSNVVVWTKAGCGGQATDTYRTKPTSTASSASYRWGYFNCYPTTKLYPNKPVWACERKWVPRSDTIKTDTTWAIKSAQDDVKKRHTQFQADYKAWYSTKAYYDGNISDDAFGADCKNNANGNMVTSSSRTVKVGSSNKTKGKTNTLVCKAQKAY